ncbi:MAG: hypothetical protein WC959_11555 [Kiritimatiellales bacterium]
MSGSFCGAVTYTDLICEWTVLHAVWDKSAAAVVEQTQDVEGKLPFALPGFDPDNGSEFINQHLADDLLKRKRPGCFTRSRPYRKNDNAHAEQKNWTHEHQRSKPLIPSVSFLCEAIRLLSIRVGDLSQTSRQCPSSNRSR